MASQTTIQKRQSELKKHLLSKNLSSVSFFEDVKPLYEETSFINKFGKVSESRMREDLKSIGYVYSNKEDAHILESKYFDLEVELRIIKHLFFMNLYRPISIDLVPFDTNEDSVSKFSYILLSYQKSNEKSMQQYNISNLLKDLRVYYQHVYNSPNLGELDIISNENYIKFEFLDSDSLDLLYKHLEVWKLKGKQQDPFTKRKLGRKNN